ncbi:MAG: SIMPL domain-containing protein [Eubacteriales bacterium]|nr:SIMPL domain-containing protein [Eubacteriales bacterium]
MKRLFAVLTLCALLPMTAMAQTTAAIAPVTNTMEQSAVLTTVGSAEVSVKPDMVLLTFHMVSTATTVAAAQEAAVQQVDALSQALEGLQISSEDIYTSAYAVTTQYSYQYGKLGEGETPTGYNISSDIAVRLRQLNQLGQVVDVALQLGAEADYDLSFESSKIQEAYDKAMALAVGDGMRKAELLAASAGKTLGALKTVTELEEGLNPTEQVRAASDDSAENILRYLLTIEASVEVSYEMK